MTLLFACAEVDERGVVSQEKTGPLDQNGAEEPPIGLTEPPIDLISPIDTGFDDRDAGSFGRADMFTNEGIDLDVVDPQDMEQSPPPDSEDLGLAPITPCAVSEVVGECVHVDDCDGESIPGYCPGPAVIQCCVDEISAPTVSCSVNGEAGECVLVSTCQGTAVPGYCPGDSMIQCCLEGDVSLPPGDQCLESASWDLMPRPNEGLYEEQGDLGCPMGMARVSGYCVDRFEASLVERLMNGSERSWSPFFNPGTRDVYAVSLRYGVPQGYMSGTQAQRACQASGKRLCTDQEWLRACSGPSSYVFPYGDTREWGVCHDARAQHPAISYFGTSDDSIWSMLSNPCINQQPDSLTSNDQHQGYVSDEGVYHMVGGLHEWTSDPSGTFRGGFYADTTRNGVGCAYRTTAHNVEHSDYSTGFRCCADAR